jgi:hypothetical protein
MDTQSVLALFDEQMRRNPAFGDAETRVERNERTTYCLGGDWSAVVWSDLDEQTADAEIARAVERLAAIRGHAEWKYYSHDRPADLPQRLAAAGLVPDEEEAVLVAELAALDVEPALPDGVELRVVRTKEDMAAAVAVHERVFGGDQSGTARVLRLGLEQDPPSTLGIVAVAGGDPVSAGRIDFNEQSDFASIWGGSTVEAWRGRGIYRASVALRAKLARERGYRYLQVDALPTSRPILERLGFVLLTTTTPYQPDGRSL